MEARGSEGGEDSHPFPRQLHGSPMVPGTPNEHRPPLQTSALGLCEGQKTLHSHKNHPSHHFSFPIWKRKCLWSLPTAVPLTCVHAAETGAREWSPRRAHVRQERRGRAIGHLTDPAPGQALHLPTEHGRARHRG